MKIYLSVLADTNLLVLSF